MYFLAFLSLSIGLQGKSVDCLERRNGNDVSNFLGEPGCRSCCETLGKAEVRRRRSHVSPAAGRRMYFCAREGMATGSGTLAGRVVLLQVSQELFHGEGGAELHPAYGAVGRHVRVGRPAGGRRRRSRVGARRALERRRLGAGARLARPRAQRLQRPPGGRKYPQLLSVARWRDVRRDVIDDARGRLVVWRRPYLLQRFLDRVHGFHLVAAAAKPST